MKTLFLEAKYNNPIALTNKELSRLEGNIGLVSSIQFLDSLPLIKNSLNKNILNQKQIEENPRVSPTLKGGVLKNLWIFGTTLGYASVDSQLGFSANQTGIHPLHKWRGFLPVRFKNKIKKAIICGQVLGCDVSCAERAKDKVDAFLYIGDGAFHPLAVALGTGKRVYQLNPINNSFRKIEQKEVEDYLKRRKGALLKFLNADVVGVLVSTKPGQSYDVKKLGLLEKKYPDKKFYTFIADTIDCKQLENFPFIQAWVNTACPRMEEDISVVNVSEIG